ncbi:MAG: rod shape-determining protein RodA [Syntrophobacterales bacterium]|jgi:rod shape determining protein RodA|nr:rod shape-determining protein RodA [Syntrophobacterales bacterium]
MFDRRLVQNFDYLLLALVLIICGMGIVNLYSAGYNRGEGTPLYVKQLYWLAVGLGMLFVTLIYDYRHLEKLAYPIYILSILMLLAVMFGGKVVYGSRRWLALGPVSFQPSELAKIGIILALATYFSRRPRTESMRLKDLLVPGLLVMIPVALIIKQPDLGSGILVVLVAASIILFVGVNWRTLAGCGLTLVLLSPLLWHFLKDYQRQRVLTFLNPEKDPLGAGYHILQSMIAVGSGQFWGKGFLQGTQSQLYFLPEQHTDFVFSVFAEEWGFVGSAVLLLLFTALAIWGLTVARDCKDRFGYLLAVGVTALIFWQIFINLCMVTGFLPVVGIPLPLFSYGGSSLITTLLGVGFLLNIRMRRYLFGG